MNGARIYFYLFGNEHLAITETIVNSWILIAIVFVVCKVLTSNLQIVPKGKQIVAEMAVSGLDTLVTSTMGCKYVGSYAPYIGTIMIFSALGSLMSLFGFRPVTGDLNTTLGWALMTFIMIQYNGIKHNGVFGRLKGMCEPIPIMLPINLISEVANPISMSFRHFGNIAAGLVITQLMYSALASLSGAVFGVGISVVRIIITLVIFGLIVALIKKKKGWNIPMKKVTLVLAVVGVVILVARFALQASVPILQIGLPSILSVYFDLFTAFMQAFIFCMLTMSFVAMAE